MKTKGAQYIWFDGEFVEWEKAQIPITTHALHYGTSVFEGIRAYNSKDNLYIFKLREHVERIFRSAFIYSIKINHSIDDIMNAIVSLLRKCNIKESCYIRPITFVGTHGIDLNVSLNSPTHTVVIVFPFARYFNPEGIKVGISSWRRIHDSATPPMAKAGGNYLNSVLATQECKRNGYDEAIMLDMEGTVSEAPGENIFILKNKTLYTPDISSSILYGITRDTVITLSRDLGYEIVERPISRTELYLADEIFLTGTAAEIVGVISVDGREISNGKEGKVTVSIRELYEKIVSGESTAEKYSSWTTPVW
jgi:branched-chain amino acid aminotransferase